MTENRIRKILILMAGFFCCKIPLAGCYPVLPAFFTAAYLEEIPRALFTIVVFAGMAVFFPITQTAKYGVAVLVILVIVRITEWVEKYCYSWFAALVAGITTASLSVCGHMLLVKDRLSIQIGILEGVLVFGLTMLLSRVLHGVMEFKLPERGRKKIQPTEELGTDHRLARYADSFQGLSRVFYGMERHEGVSGEEMTRMTNELAEKCCADCAVCMECWNTENNLTREYFREIIKAVIKAGKADRDMVTEFGKRCPYYEKVAEEAVKVFEKVNLNLAWYNRLIENRIVIAEQLDAMAYIMEELAEGEEDISGKRRRNLSDLKYRAREHGIKISQASVQKKKNGHERLTLLVCQRGDSCIPVKVLTEEVGMAFHRAMVPARDTRTIIGRENTEIVYEEEPRFHSVFGMAKRMKEGATVSGDNFSVLETDQGEVVYSLSDGMGFGSRACKESELVLELIEKFLEAGFDKETAIRMMNSAMVIHGEDEKYSTIDISSLDLYEGSCNFYKVGAAAGFIKHGTMVESLVSTSLPVGSFYGMDIEKTEYQLSEGDFIIMMTDGALEDLHVPDPVSTMEEIIETVQTNHPGKMAEKILERVLMFTGGFVRDDMTVLVAALWEN